MCLLIKTVRIFIRCCEEDSIRWIWFRRKTTTTTIIDRQKHLFHSSLVHEVTVIFVGEILHVIRWRPWSYHVFLPNHRAMSISRFCIPFVMKKRSNGRAQKAVLGSFKVHDADGESSTLPIWSFDIRLQNKPLNIHMNEWLSSLSIHFPCELVREQLSRQPQPAHIHFTCINRNGPELKSADQISVTSIIRPFRALEK